MIFGHPYVCARACSGSIGTASALARPPIAIWCLSSRLVTPSFLGGLASCEQDGAHDQRDDRGRGGDPAPVRPRCAATYQAFPPTTPATIASAENTVGRNAE